MTMRDDIHRVSQIIPENYEYILTYSLSTTYHGAPVPSFGINCELDYRQWFKDGSAKNGNHSEDGNCCVVGLRQIGNHKMAEHGGPGSCTVCGAWHIYGDVWKNKHTEEHIFVGWICADKYKLVANRDAFKRNHRILCEKSAHERLKKQKEEKKQKFLEDRPTLAQALETDHEIVRNIKNQLDRQGEISDKQVELVFKLYRKSQEPSETYVQAHIQDGRQTVEGKIVSLKSHITDFGQQLKMTVKVETNEGVWLAWGTCPQSLLDQACHSAHDSRLKYRKVRFEAKLKQGRDKHFAVFSRPSKAKIVQ